MVFVGTPRGHLCAVGGFMTLSGCYFFGLHQGWGFVCGTRQNATFADVAAYGGGAREVLGEQCLHLLGATAQQWPSNDPMHAVLRSQRR